MQYTLRTTATDANSTDIKFFWQFFGIARRTRPVR